MSKRRSPATHSYTPYRDKYRLFYGCPTMTDAAQERVDEQTNAERHKKAVREWSDDELTRAARNQAGRLDEAGQFGVADLLYELTRRLRARQREEGDVDTRTIGLALNDISSIVRQDWVWTTELQRHYDLAMDALRVEPPAERETRDDEWPNVPYERQVP